MEKTLLVQQCIEETAKAIGVRREPNESEDVFANLMARGWRGGVGTEIDLSDGNAIDKVMFRDCDDNPVAIVIRKVHRSYNPDTRLPYVPVCYVYTGASDVLLILRDIDGPEPEADKQ